MPRPLHLEPEVARTYTIKKVLERIDADKPDARGSPRESVLAHSACVARKFRRYHQTTNEWAAERITIDGEAMTVTAPETVHAEIVRMLMPGSKAASVKPAST